MASILTVTDWIAVHQVLLIRGTCFAAVFALMAVWEIRAPARALKRSKGLRWVNNLALVVLNTVLLRLLFPAAAVGMAVFAADQGWGLLNHFALPLWLAIVIALIVLDFVTWLYHVMVHAIPLLWRLHRVHHADPDYDLTTGARFHPFEILLSMLVKFAAIAVLGPPVVAVVLFEILLNATSMFNHGNVRLPARVEPVLRWFIVTPDMHRVHHSVEDDESNSNFGFNLPWWDRLFGTYRAQPRRGHQGMSIGIHEFSAPREVSWLPGLLTLPFRGRIGGYAINRRQWSAPHGAHGAHWHHRGGPLEGHSDSTTP
jgi:sterol desaturase/sphingolipid hydroxylase (fatty acid hydroxylase superfamily)